MGNKRTICLLETLIQDFPVYFDRLRLAAIQDQGSHAEITRSASQQREEADADIFYADFKTELETTLRDAYRKAPLAYEPCYNTGPQDEYTVDQSKMEEYQQSLDSLQKHVKTRIDDVSANGGVAGRATLSAVHGALEDFIGDTQRLVDHLGIWHRLYESIPSETV